MPSALSCSSPSSLSSPASSRTHNVLVIWPSSPKDTKCDVLLGHVGAWKCMKTKANKLIL
jgi:hypothetical protein